MVDEQIRAAAVAWVDALIAAGEAEEWEEADAFVVMTTNAETQYIHLNGPFPDPVTAMAWAETHETDLNKGNGPDDDPFVVVVLPMLPVSDGQER